MNISDEAKNAMRLSLLLEKEKELRVKLDETSDIWNQKLDEVTTELHQVENMIKDARRSQDLYKIKNQGLETIAHLFPEEFDLTSRPQHVQQMFHDIIEKWGIPSEDSYEDAEECIWHKHESGYSAWLMVSLTNSSLHEFAIRSELSFSYAETVEATSDSYFVDEEFIEIEIDSMPLTKENLDKINLRISEETVIEEVSLKFTSKIPHFVRKRMIQEPGSKIKMNYNEAVQLLCAMTYNEPDGGTLCESTWLSPENSSLQE
jgi:hypothetical protein